MKNKFAKMAGCLSLLLLVTACNAAVPKAGENGELLTYKKISDIPSVGFYVMGEEGIHPLYRENRNFNKQPEESMDLSQRLLFMMGEENLIPTLTPGDTLIYINDTQPITQPVSFEKMVDCGYTMGIAFKPRPESIYIGFKDVTIIGGSSAKESFGEITNSVAYTLRQINGVDLTKDLLDENGFVKNLEKNAKYRIDGYKGTSYVEFITIADVHLFMSDSFITIPSDSAYRLTKEGYAIVNLPADLEDGIYCLSGYGIFRYQSKENANPDTTEQTTTASGEATTESATAETSFVPAAGTVDPEAIGLTMTSLADEFFDGMNAKKPDED